MRNAIDEPRGQMFYLTLTVVMWTVIACGFIGMLVVLMLH
jgi:hypothetical protein